MVAWFLISELVIKPKLEANIIARATRFPESDTPRLQFLPVIYNKETKRISSFTINFHNCCGLAYFQFHTNNKMWSRLKRYTKTPDRYTITGSERMVHGVIY